MSQGSGRYSLECKAVIGFWFWCPIQLQDFQQDETPKQTEQGTTGRSYGVLGVGFWENLNPGSLDLPVGYHGEPKVNLFHTIIRII